MNIQNSHNPYSLDFRKPTVQKQKNKIASSVIKSPMSWTAANVRVKIYLIYLDIKKKQKT